MKSLTLLIMATLMTVPLSAQIVTRKESVQSLYLTTFRDSVLVSVATGFVIRSKTRNYLITNWHVLSNKHPVTLAWADSTRQMTPNRIGIIHNGNQLGTHVVKWETLVDANGARQYEQFKIGNEMVDVVALALKDTLTDIQLYPVDYRNIPDSTFLSPTDRLFIVGFPLGITGTSSLPIWKSGTIASEPDIDQENKPIIWVDGVGYPGMSGSPVYFISDRLQTRKDGSTSPGNPQSLFIGVYSHLPFLGTIGLGALWKGPFVKFLFNKLP